jgi:hypothetical protein
MTAASLRYDVMEQHSEDYEHKDEYADGDRNPDEEPPFRQWWTGVAHLSSDRVVARSYACA